MSLMSGVYKDGLPANIFTLTNCHGMSISVMDIGATWLSCLLPIQHHETSEIEQREILLGTANLDDFQKQTAYMGATVGRVANRIAKGRFTLNDIEYQLPINNGENCLHGGTDGFSHRRWQVEAVTNSHVSFSLISPDGDQGFPGNLHVLVNYQLTDNNQVIIEYVANTDKATPVNLTNHAYFNLLGAETGENILAHRLQVDASQYLSIHDDLIPTGELLSVDNTGFDFNQLKTIKQDFLKDKAQLIASGYDHALVLNQTHNNAINARLLSPDNKVQLQIITSQPALHIYSGNFLQGNPSRKENMQYHNFAGIALETEYFPDSPNQSENILFPDCILTPKKEYKENTTYQFIF